MERRFIYDSGTAVVKTQSGTFRGYIDDDVTVFKGIPYAHAKRFHRPEPAVLDGIFDAANYGFVCPLLTIDKPVGELFCPHRYWPQNEDCMNLNIWTPACDDGIRPVMVWLHGGGYGFGSAIEQQAYEGGNMAHYGDTVVVSVNHRLNILGFFDVSDFGEEYENSGNAGMEDIICALKWIRLNIASFGGDPDNVTLFGQSGGGAKITTLLQMPEADGLFMRGINMSGVVPTILPDCEQTEKEIAEAIMADLGLKDIHELENADYYLFAKSYQRLSPEFQKADISVGGTPHLNAYYAGDPLLHGFRKESKDAALIVGSVYGEFTSFMPAPLDRKSLSDEEGVKALRSRIGEKEAGTVLPLFRKAYPDRHPVDLLMLDTLFRPEIQKYVLKRAEVCPKHTYSYMFNVDMPIDGGRTPWHCSDIPYIFHNTALSPYTQEAGVTERIENQIFQAVMAFARTGNPANTYLPVWPSCTKTTENTMVFGKNSAEVKPDFDQKLIKAALKNMKLSDFGSIQH